MLYHKVDLRHRNIHVLVIQYNDAFDTYSFEDLYQ